MRNINIERSNIAHCFLVIPPVLREEPKSVFLRFFQPIFRFWVLRQAQQRGEKHQRDQNRGYELIVIIIRDYLPILKFITSPEIRETLTCFDHRFDFDVCGNVSRRFDNSFAVIYFTRRRFVIIPLITVAMVHLLIVID